MMHIVNDDSQKTSAKRESESERKRRENAKKNAVQIADHKYENHLTLSPFCVDRKLTFLSLRIILSCSFDEMKVFRNNPHLSHRNSVTIECIR